MTDTPRVKLKTFPDRVERFLEFVGGVMTDYERDEPLWESHTLLDVTHGAVGSLRYYLKHGDAVRKRKGHDEAEPAWATPEVELQYAVEWDWEGDRMVSATVTDEELGEDPKTWGKPGVSVFVTHRNLYVLQRATRHALVRRRSGLYFRLVPSDLVKKYPPLAERDERGTARWELADELLTSPEDDDAKKALDARYRPFVLTAKTLGAVSQEFTVRVWENLFASGEAPGPLPEGVSARDLWRDVVTPEDKRRLFYDTLDRLLTEEKDGPLLNLQGDRNGKTFSAALSVTIHPLVVDEDEKRAYYPIVVSLLFEGEAEHPKDWTAEEREALWTGFAANLKDVRETLDRMVPPAVPREHRLRVDDGLTVQVREDVHVQDVTTPSLDSTARVEPPAVEPPPPPSPLPEPRMGPPPLERKTFPLAFGRTLADADAVAIARAVHRVRFPARRWATLLPWHELVNAEVLRLQDEEGERAFESIPRGRPALLKKGTRKGQTVVTLTPEGERLLKIREGLTKNGFRYNDPQTGLEYLSRLFEWRDGYLEIGLSWFGLAGPWVEDWRREKQREAAETERSLFELLDPDRQAEVERRLLHARLLDDSHRLMECVLAQVGKQRQNVVAIPAEAFRLLLGLQEDPHWKARLEGGLAALRACEFYLRALASNPLKGYGSFLGSWVYDPKGAGSHGDGTYFLEVTHGFLGCLSVFETSKRKVGPEGLLASTFDFSKKPTEEEKAALGWEYDRKTKTHRKASAYFVELDAGRVFYDAQAGLSPTQSALHAFIDEQLTRRGGAVSRVLGNVAARKREQLGRSHADAKLPRVYDAAFCPLLPEGRRYHAALGDFGRGHGETGWTLYGTARRESRTGGAHKAGLLDRMGYVLPVGGATKARAEIVRKALEDLKAVVVDYLGGVVAAHHGGRWLSLEEAAKLPDDELGRRTRWFLFVPETYRTDRVKKFEDATNYRVTEDPAEAARAALGDLGTELPLRLRLRMARLDRKLSQAAVGKLFDVTQQAVAYWELGTEPDEAGKVKGKPIPGELVPLVERWVQDGTPPSPEDLAARKTARTGVEKAGAGEPPTTLQ